MAVTVACCLWGDWPEKGWGEEYVYRLYRGVSRNLSVPHEFVCFSDDIERLPDAPFEVRKLNAPSWLGCLPKTYVYSPDAGLSGRVILFDLDNIITGSLDDMASYDGDIAVRAWFRGYPKERVPDGDMISFDASTNTDLWERIASDPKAVEEATGGRERWYIRSVKQPDLWQDVLPESNQIVSYKNHCRNGLPENARVVSCHGNPRPHEIEADWIKEHWI